MESLPTVELQLKHHALAGSGGSYYVHYNATVELTHNPKVTVTLESLQCDREPDTLSDASVDAITTACERVLQRYGFGGKVAVRDLGIHDVDCWPPQYERWTERALQSEMTKRFGDQNSG